jgi:hypothetical protein
LAALAVIAGGALWWRGQGSAPQQPPASQVLAGQSQGSGASGTGGASTAAGTAARAAGDKLHVLIAGDVSRSVNPALRQSAMDGLKFALRNAVPGGTALHFVFYDRDARTRPGVVEFYEPRDLDEVSADFVKYEPRPEKGTRQALALSRLEREANSLPPGTPTAFVLLTDGEDQDAPATTSEARRLAERPGFRALLVVGAQMESRSRVYLRDKLDAALAPLQERKIVCGPEVSDREVDQFRALVGS